MIRRPPRSTLFPTRRSSDLQIQETLRIHDKSLSSKAAETRAVELLELVGIPNAGDRVHSYPHEFSGGIDRKSTRLNSSHANISYAVFCLKKKTIRHHISIIQ